MGFNFELDIPPGFDSDDTSFSAQGRWVDGSGIRFYQGRPQPIGSHVANGGGGPYANVTKLAVYTVSGSTRVASAGDLLISIRPGVSDTNITPVGWATGTRNSLAMWGDVLLASNKGGKLFQSVAGAVATLITQAPVAITCMLVTPTRQVMALGCNEVVSGTFNGRCIRFTDTEDLTDWTPVASNLSDEVILEGQEPIVGACLLGEYVVVWTSGALFLGSFTGDPSQPWRFDRVAETGLLALDAFAIRGSTIYFMGPDLRVYTYAAGQRPVQIPCPISRDYMENMNLADRGATAAFYNTRFDEVWFFWIDGRVTPTTYPNAYIAFAVSESEAAQRPVWFRGEVKVSAIVDDPLLASIFTRTGIAAMYTAGGPIDLAMWDCNDPNNVSEWSIRSGDQYFDKARRRVLIRSFYPDFQGTNVDDALLTIYVRSSPADEAIIKGPFTFNMSDGKVACRCSGKIISIKLSSIAGNLGFARLGKPLFDVEPMGNR